MPRGRDRGAVDHAVAVIHRVCGLAGHAGFLDDTDPDGTIRSAISRHDTAALYDWLISALSYQGISDQVAYDYMARHGQPTWRAITRNLAGGATCPKLQSYWQFHGCRYDKTSRTCAEPDHIDRCPLPTHNLRNGRLNQTAFSLYLFIRDIAAGDLVGWIDRQLQNADDAADPHRPRRLRAALIGPLRHVYGVADKVLSMALACILLSAPKNLPLWIEAGGSMIAIDTLVHNFLHRTGILRQFHAAHPYGAGCYQAGGCADIIEAVADRIDARVFNPGFPKTFPRFVQYAIWRYCNQLGLDICNGNQIDDRNRCCNANCHVFSICDRIALHNSDKSSVMTSK